jgi:hypothetical protein
MRPQLFAFAPPKECAGLMQLAIHGPSRPRSSAIGVFD